MYYVSLKFLGLFHLIFPCVRLILLEWFFFAFIVTTAYGGNLRAFLLHPDATPAVESIGAIVHSGLSWKVVLYGGLDESWFWFYRNEDSDIGRYWREKEGVSFKDMPFEEVTDNTIQRHKENIT